MSEPANEFMLWCWVLDDPPNRAFTVSVKLSAPIHDLKKAIHAQKPSFKDVAPDALEVYKFNLRLETFNEVAQNINLEDGLQLTTWNNISFYWTEDPGKVMSVILPRPYGTSITPSSSQNSKLSQQAAPSQHSISTHVLHPTLHPTDSSVPLDPSLSQRTETVTALYEKLKAYHLILVRGTPASGKTVLTRLLEAHIRQKDLTVEKILRIFSWPPLAGRGCYASILKENGWVEHEKTVFIFDEGQMTYNDWGLWNDFFKSIHEGGGTRRAIIFASYGSPTSRIIIMENTLMELPNCQQVTLHPVDHEDDLAPAGLLFTKDEFNDLVDCNYRHSHYLDQSFYDGIFEITNGHVGAITDFIKITIADNSYRNLKNYANPAYTWNLFMARVSPHRFLQRLDSSSIFRRGLPLDIDIQKSATTHIFSVILCQGFVKDTDYPDQSDEKKALQECYRKGWLQADLAGGTTGYFFPSSLHRWHVEWKLWGSVDQIQAEFQSDNLLRLVIDVIRLFSPRRLSAERRLGPGCIQRLPEAQYQDELYRCCHTLSEGSLLTLPEFGTAKGRVDFYVPAKCWGIELLRDGDRLANHWGRFSKGGSYSESLPLTDYIIVDCRTTHPRQQHPDMSKLYHAVFEDNFCHVRILDNMLCEVEDFDLLERQLH